MLETEWILEGNNFIRTIKITGVVTKRIGNDDFLSEALEIFWEIKRISDRYRGRLMSRKNPPTVKAKEFIYFEIIFPNNTNYLAFLRAFRRKFL